MEVYWFTPFVNDSSLAAGVILQSEDEARNLMEYIPYPLDIESIDAILDRGADWLLRQMPDAIPAFLTIDEAMRFMHDVYVLTCTSRLTNEAFERVLLKYRGEMREKAEYGYEVTPGAGNGTPPTGYRLN